MRRAISEIAGFILLTSAISAPLSAEQRWTRVASPNFEIYTTANERAARDTLRYFEQVRGFFSDALSHSKEKWAPVRIVAFNSTKEFEPYRFNQFAIAYYHAMPDRDYIVMSHTGADTSAVAIHEYVHLVAQHSKLNLPPWLNEGIAELYSTIYQMGDKVVVGALIEGRHQALLRDKWVPLDVITSAGHDSPYYNEKDKAGSLYNEGWALTHMLAMGENYRKKFPEFMVAIAGGGSCESILELVYGKNMKTVEKELIQYLNGGHFTGALLPNRLGKLDDDLKIEPAADFDVKLSLAEISDQKGKETETRKALEALIASDPNRAEPYEDLANLDMREHRDADARAHVIKAFDAGSRNPQTIWNAGVMTQGSDPAKAEQAFGELLKLQPERTDVRIQLGWVQFRLHKSKEALETIAPVKKVTPQDAPQLLNLLARASLETGDREKAIASATQLKSIAKTPEDRDRADQLLRYVEGSRAPARAAGPAPSPPKRADGAPVMQRREAPVSTLREIRAPERPSFNGKLVEMQCGAQPKLVIDTPEGKKRFLIDDPNKLMVNGNSGQQIELVCGAQKPVQVRIEYDAAAQAGFDGLARGIQFNP